MPKRAWCSDCNSYVALTAEELCPNGHPRCALRGIEEVSASSMPPTQVATTPVSSFGPPPAPAIASGAASATWDQGPLPSGSKTTPTWMVVAGIVLALGIGFVAFKLIMGPKHGVVHTQNGLVVTVPKGWGVVADKPTQFLVTPDGNDKIAVQVDRMLDSTRLLEPDLITVERTGAEQEGNHVDDVVWMGHRAIAYRSQSGTVGQLRTKMWDGNATTYTADYNASGSDFDAHLAEANAIVQSIQVAKN